MSKSSNLKKEDKRIKDIANAIRLTWDSLESHLTDTYEPIYKKLKQKVAKEHIGDANFHRKCIKEYAEIMKTLADQI